MIFLESAETWLPIESERVESKEKSLCWLGIEAWLNYTDSYRPKLSQGEKNAATIVK